MSRENVEAARRAYEGYARHGVDAILAFAHPDIEIDESPEFPDTGKYRGHDGAKRLYGLFAEQFDPFEMRLDDVIDAGDEKVVVCLRVGGIAKQSGVEIFLPSFHVLTGRQGKAERMQVFLDRKQALEAAGLSE